MDLPDALLTRLTNQFGSVATRTMLLAMSEKRLPTFRVNTLHATDETVMATLREDAIQFERVRDIPHAFFVKNKTDKELLAHALTTSGKIYLQGLTSMLPPLVLDAQPHESVLDLCAAPGSKTSQIAALMKNTGRLVACEIDEVRFEKLKHTLTLQGVNAQALHIDATLLHHTHNEVFDRVLADVPCSAEGRINLNDRRSFSFWSQKNIIEHAKLQRRLLRSAVACLKPGGTLVYSTCTLAPEENEGQIAWLVDEFPMMQPVAITLPFSGKQGLYKTATLLPTSRYEGFFISKLMKSTDGHFAKII
ncbi:RsmB/NOP family class I SAM-dependent RNA methyltransferase [Candidatus Uhrbacteria bacterium]|nr:RsmB/NOP family class I SAM-dependent RNA methyltransferase [Candidatus Uhrbacteria bacterium]